MKLGAEILVNNKWETMVNNDKEYVYNDVLVTIDNGKVSVTATKSPLYFIRLSFENTYLKKAKILSDAWERAYADMEWAKINPHKKMPWYFMAYAEDTLYGFGVKTQPNAMCFWQCSDDRISLTLDLRNGTNGLILSGRILSACSIVTAEYSDDVFQAQSEFCGLMCDNPRIPSRQIYGGNDWYCNYGNNSYEKILTHTKRIVECSPKDAPKPYMVIDDGWEICHQDDEKYGSFNGGPWKCCNNNFKDMKKMAEAIEAAGAIPGIWFRPLWTMEKVSEECILKKDGLTTTLDPSSDSVLEMVKSDVETLRNWGYKLIKHDFSSFDISGKWGFQTEDDLYSEDLNFKDKTRTTAEIINRFYSAIRDAAGDDVLVMGCNTYSHLSAGIFDIQRTGDDTSGVLWERTKQYGINTLAFRMGQHNRFYCADADCVGITNDVDWKFNSQWLDVLSKSGTALFVSIAEDAYSDEVKDGLKKAFALSVTNTEPSQPLDWMETKLPRKWKSKFGTDEYNWE